MSKIYCLNCGNEMDSEIRFCPSCGAANTQFQAPVVEASQEVTETVSEVAQEIPPVQPQPVPVPESAPQMQYSNVTPAYNAYQQGPVNAGPQGPSKALAIVSLVLGILSIVCCWCGGFSGLLMSIPAVVCGAIALAKKMGGKGMAIAGVICGGIAIILSIITGAVTASAPSFYDEYMDVLEDYGIDVDDFT